MQATNTVRRYYSPLDVSVSVVCTTPQCSTMQTYDGATYVPNRETDGGTTLRPIINATAADGTWNDGLSNISLANIKWYVYTDQQWQDVTAVSDWSSKVTIDTSATASKGSITIKKNIPSNSNVQLRFEADLVDYRTQENHHIVADPISLVTADKGEDTWGLAIGDSDNIVYNPALDMLDLYEYKVSHGISAASDSAKQEAMDGNQYLCTIPVKAYKGSKQQTSGYTINVYRMTDNAQRTLLAADGTNELISASTESITLDLRLVKEATYLIAIPDTERNVDLASKSFSVKRRTNVYDILMTNTGDLGFNDVARWQKAVVTTNNNTCQYPSRFLQMNWSTKALNNGSTTTHEWQEGDYMEYKLADVGVGTLETDTITDLLEYAEKPAHEVLTDESGEIFCDENGEALIAN